MKTLKYQTAKQKGKIHAEAMKRWDECTSREEKSRRYSTEDKIHNSANGGQWADFSTTRNGDGISNANDVDERPRYEINIAAPVITKLVGEQRQMDIGPKLSPEGDNASKKEVEILESIIRHIEKNSHARDAYDNAYNETLQGGYGGWQITTNMTDEDVFDQEAGVEPIDDTTSSLYFGPSKLYDKSDAAYAFHAYDLDKGVYNATYPKAQDTPFTDNSNTVANGVNEDWFNENTIRLAVYWRKKSIRKTIVQLSDGKIEDLKDIESVLDELALGKPQIDPVTQRQVIDQTGQPVFIPGSQITVVNQRETQSYVLEKFIINGNEILEQNTTYKGKFIPLIPVFGERQVINGAEIVHGKIRFTKDAARVFNYAFSSITEKAALSRPDILMMTPEQMQGHESELADMNVSRKPVQQYNSIDESGELIQAPAPFAIAPPTVETALINLAETAKLNILAVMGTSGQTTIDGTAMDSRSGQAITAAQTGADTGSFLYLDNLLKSIEYSYKVLVDLIPHIYDTQRQIRITKPGGETEIVTINEEVVDTNGDGGTVIVNDLSFGKFGVSVKSGPAFATARAEAEAGLIKILEIIPSLADEASDILVGLQDNTGAEELSKRVKEGKIRRGELIPSEEEAEEMGLQRDQLIIQNAMPQIRQQIMQEEQTKLLGAQVAALEGQALESEAKARTQSGIDLINQKKAQASIIEAQAKLIREENAQVKTDADVRKTDAETNRTTIEANNKYLEGLVLKAQSLGIPLTIMDHDNRIGQEDLVEISQMVIDPELFNSNQVAAAEQNRNLEALIQVQQGGLRVV